MSRRPTGTHRQLRSWRTTTTTTTTTTATTTAAGILVLLLLLLLLLSAAPLATGRTAVAASSSTATVTILKPGRSSSHSSSSSAPSSSCSSSSLFLAPSSQLEGIEAGADRLLLLPTKLLEFDLGHDNDPAAAFTTTDRSRTVPLDQRTTKWAVADPTEDVVVAGGGAGGVVVASTTTHQHVTAVRLDQQQTLLQLPPWRYYQHKGNRSSCDPCAPLESSLLFKEKKNHNVYEEDQLEAAFAAIGHLWAVVG